jgi:5-methylcytosine-specific restriction endonuclease McrA
MIDLDKAIKYKGRSRLPSFKWQELRDHVLKRDHHKCTKCGSTKDLEIDHIKAVTLGGDDSFDNLVTLCKSCHLVKTSEDIEKKRRLRRFKQNRIGGFD